MRGKYGIFAMNLSVFAETKHPFPWDSSMTARLGTIPVIPGSTHRFETELV